ncbi:HET-domain-containing protein, partial [Tothia fuscella]
YQYTPLPSNTSFRFLELLPGPREEAPSYRLHFADWNSPPEYEAISYAWGNLARTHSSLCDNKSMEITQSLHECLVHIRHQDASRVLWADAGCIDQSNVDERNFQVSNMRQIYKNAQKVLVWLG